MILLLLTGCSANGLVIRYFYGEIDVKLYDRIIAYATFTEEQKAQIKQAVDEYTEWHKQNELPRYAKFLDNLSIQLSEGNMTYQMVLDNFKQAREFARAGFEHSPIYKHPRFFETLTDQQVKQIENHFFEQDKEFEKWYQQRQQDGADKARLERIIKNTKRIADISLNENQQQVIKTGLEQIKSEPRERHEIYNKWQAEFIDLLYQRQKADFGETIVKHLAVYQDQIELKNPEQYQHSQQIAAQVIADVVSSLDGTQKQNLINRLNQTRETLLKISTGA